MYTRVTFIRKRLSAFIGALLAVTSLVGTVAHAEHLDTSALVPASAFIQAGFAEQKTRAYVAGLTWDWNWQKQFSALTATGYFEAAFGRWETEQDGVKGSSWATQVGITPVLRLQPAALPKWFAEIGVGANFILPIYRSREKQFSTEFNFGDHFAVGRQFGAHNEHELAVRVQHFSNGGIDHPNPGENFIQIRYSHRL